MRAEVSAIFHLQSADVRAIHKAHVGSGVFIERLEDGWLSNVKAQCPEVDAREQIEYQQPYTHRFFYELEPDRIAADSSNLASHVEKQLTLRAIILSRLVKPTSIGYDSVWIKSLYRDDGIAEHFHKQVINNLNVAFLSGGQEDWNTITEADVNVMIELWPSMQFFLDDANEPKYRRIVRAIKYHEFAYAIPLPELSHPIIHAALESMICVGHRQNKAQINQRLPQQVTFVTPQQAEDIYRTCCGFKHEAQAMLQHKPVSTGVFKPSDQRRVDAVKLLRQAIRDLLIRAFRDRSFADILSNPQLLRNAYPVFDKKGQII